MKSYQLTKTKVFAPLTFLIFSAPSISNAVNITYDFESYNGTGFAASPVSSGMLDSNDWAVSGMSDGDVNFGGYCDTGDCARGFSTGGVVTSGLYAFNTGNNRIFGMQPGGSDLTPGLIDLRVSNETGATWSQIGIEYDIWVLNNGSQSSSLNFSYSLNGIDYTSVASLDFSTPELADSSGWGSTLMNATISGLNVSEYVYLRWTTNDAAGTGARDEFGLDNISVSAVPVPAAVWLFGSGLIGLLAVARRKKS